MSRTQFAVCSLPSRGLYSNLASLPNIEREIVMNTSKSSGPGWAGKERL